MVKITMNLDSSVTCRHCGMQTPCDVTPSQCCAERDRLLAQLAERDEALADFRAFVRVVEDGWRKGDLDCRMDQPWDHCSTPWDNARAAVERWMGEG